MSSRLVRREWVPSLVKGFVLPFLVPGLLLLPFVPGLASPVGYGLWFIILCATQRVWQSPLIRLVYMKRWTSLFLWPVCMASKEFAQTFLRGVAWLWGLVGLMFLLLAAVSPTGT
jgi:hypothetical protein